MSDSTIAPVARDHPAHRHLVAHLKLRMSDISEDYWCAGWLIDLEFLLWDAIQGETRDGMLSATMGAAFGGPAGIAEKDLRDLAELSALVGGWHAYDRFIPLDEWLSIADEHKLKLRAGDPQ